MTVYNCGCQGADCDCNEFVGLGSAPGGVPVNTGGILQTASAAISNELKNIINNAVAGFGSGHGEADIIVPVQNRLAIDLDRIFNSWRTVSLSQLLVLYDELKADKATFVAFVSDPRFTDGRASAQALADINPLIDENLHGMEARIASMGGHPNTTLPMPYVGNGNVYTSGFGGSLDTTTLLMLGVGAFLLFRGKF